MIYGDPHVPLPNRTHKKWFITFIDDHTRLCWVYLLTDKTEVRSVFMNFTIWYKLSFTPKFKFFVLIMVLSILITPWALIYKKMVLYIKVLALTPLSKTGLQNRKIDIFLKLLVLCCLHLTCPHNSKVTPFWQPHTLLTECLVESYLLSHIFRNSKSFFLHCRLYVLFSSC